MASDSPLMTPREGAAPRPAPSALRSSIAPLDRRNSRVSFVQDLGLDLSDESEVDMGLESDGEEILLDTSIVSDRNSIDDDSSFVSTFALADSDDDESDSDDGMDDEYEFDHAQLAELVKGGADRAQLSSVVEDAMASALERKFARKREEELKAASKLGSTTPATEAPADGDCWDLEGRMTPGQMTPPGGQMTPGRMTPPRGDAKTPEFMTPHSPDADDLAARCQRALATNNARRRRSSALKKDAGISAGIGKAMEEARERRRKSLAKATGGCHENITAAVQQANRRHRQSMSKAADVLDCAGYDEDDADCNEVAAKMRLVQQAMEDARRRHRRSIAEAVRALDEPSSKLSADTKAFADPRLKSDAKTFIDPRLNVGAGAFTPQGAGGSFGAQAQHSDLAVGDSSTWCSQDATWGGQSTNGWNCTPSPMQTRITQAVASAYQGYQQGYAEQYVDNGCGQQQCYNQMPCNQQQCCPQQYAAQQGQNVYGQQCSGQQMSAHNNPHGLPTFVPAQCYGPQNQQSCVQQATNVQQSGGQQFGGQQFGGQCIQDGYQVTYQQQCGNQCGQESYGQQIGANTNPQGFGQQCYAQQMSTPTNQQSYGQQMAPVNQQGYGQQMTAPTNQQSYGKQCYGQQGQQSYQQESYQCDQSWQYGAQGGDGASWNGNSMQTGSACMQAMENQQTYNAPWILGSA